jgi:hypothetical protein
MAGVAMRDVVKATAKPRPAYQTMVRRDRVTWVVELSCGHTVERNTYDGAPLPRTCQCRRCPGPVRAWETVRLAFEGRLYAFDGSESSAGQFLARLPDGRLLEWGFEGRAKVVRGCLPPDPSRPCPAAQDVGPALPGEAS